MNYIPGKKDTLLIEIAAMKSCYPGFRFYSHHREGYWLGKLQPSEYSDRYKVKITYRNGSPPQAFVIDPPLVKNSPHIYSPDGSLCLYYPKEQPWRKNWLIAKIFVPWISEYLYFYECWLETGQWYADEILHSKTNAIS
jgi:hypothetical protein